MGRQSQLNKEHSRKSTSCGGNDQQKIEILTQRLSEFAPSYFHSHSFTMAVQVLSPFLILVGVALPSIPHLISFLWDLTVLSE